MAKKFKEGQRVRLKPFEDNPEQSGVVWNGKVTNGTIIVRIDREQRDNARLTKDGFRDDGFREVALDQVEVSNG